MTTLAYFRGTQAIDLGKKPGATKLGKIAETRDALSCIHTVCCHAFINAGHEIPNRYASKLEIVRRASELSLAQARSIVSLWYRWSQEFHGEQIPNLLAVQSFLSALSSES